MTAKRSPLNNRAVRSTPGGDEGYKLTLKGSPVVLLGHSFRVLLQYSCIPQVLRTLRLLSEDAFSVFSILQLEIFPYAICRLAATSDVFKG